MSLNKAIEHGKEHRRKRLNKKWIIYMRNCDCQWCKSQREYRNKRREPLRDEDESGQGD